MHTLRLAVPLALLLAAAFTPNPARSVTVLFDLQGQQVDCRCPAIVYPIVSPPWVVNGVIEVSASVEQMSATRGEHFIPDTTCVDRNCDGEGIAVVSVSPNSTQSYWHGFHQIARGQNHAIPMQTTAQCNSRSKMTVLITDLPSSQGGTVLTVELKLDCGI